MIKSDVREQFITVYVKTFCPVDRYNCLMPILYERVDMADESQGAKEYRKVRCECHNVKEGKCSAGEECEHFKLAEEIIKR